jgi:hypothetical protein
MNQVQNVTSTKKYLWNYEVVNYTSGDPDETSPVIIGVYGDTGATGPTGATGRGVSQLTALYILGANPPVTDPPTAPTAPSTPDQGEDGWSATCPSWQSGYSIWTCTKIDWDDNTTTYTAPTLAQALNDANERAVNVQQAMQEYYTTTEQVQTMVKQLGPEGVAEYMENDSFAGWADAYQKYYDNKISTSAQSIVEAYDRTILASKFSATENELLAALEKYELYNRGQITRGYFTTGSGEEVFGIAISNEIQFNGTVVKYLKANGEWATQQEIQAIIDAATVEGIEPDFSQLGTEYYELVPTQTLGIYTSTGWQFWVNGIKIGWFDSLDQQLHTVNQVVEGDQQQGDWLITTTNGWGLQYIGG